MCWRASDVVCCGVEQPLQQEGAPLTRVYNGSGSAKCHWCWGDCTKEEPRVGKADKSGSKFVWRWHHVACWAQKDGKMEDATTLPNFSSLDTKQQGEVRRPWRAQTSRWKVCSLHCSTSSPSIDVSFTPRVCVHGTERSSSLYAQTHWRPSTPARGGPPSG